MDCLALHPHGKDLPPGIVVASSGLVVMDFFYATFLCFLMLNIAAAMVRLARGPSVADRLTAAQLFGSTGVGALLVLAELLQQPALRNVSLAFVLLAVMVVVCFLRTAVNRDAHKGGGAH